MSETISGQTQGFSALVTGQVAVIQAQAQPTAPLDFTVGSVLRSLTEGTAWLGLWLQGLVLQVLTLTRAATSNGADLDTWMADFGVSRIGATYATGEVNFVRYTATVDAVVPVGAQVTSGDGTQIFSVVADTLQPAFDISSGSYVVAAGVSAANVTVRNISAGTAGNVAAGFVSVLSTPISGIDYVVNSAAMSGGTAAESDSTLRARFQTFISTRAQATGAAVGYAVSGTPSVTSYTITQNQDYGAPYAYDPGSFYVVIDDGSGNPPASLVTLVANNVEAVAGCGIRSAVFPAVTEAAIITMTLVPAAGYTATVVAPLVQSVVTSYVNALPLGATLSYAGASAAAVGVTGVGSITGFLINAQARDLTVTAKQVIRTSAVSVSF